jgi:hypothetical protein
MSATLGIIRNAFLRHINSTARPAMQLPQMMLKQTRNYATPSRFPPIKYRPPTTQISDGYTRFQHNQKAPFYMSKRVWVFVGTGTVIYGGYYVSHLEKVPISGRTRFINVTPRQEEGRQINKKKGGYCIIVLTICI